MSKQLSPRQWDLLSAYIDAQLAEKDIRQVEKLLAENDDARTAFNQLRTAKSLLKQLPERPVPHHFTLTRQMAAPPRMAFVNRLMGYSSLGAMLLLVVSFAAQMFSYAPRLSFGAQAPLMELDAPVEMLEPTAPIIIWGFPFGRGGGGGAPVQEGMPLGQVPAPGLVDQGATPEAKRVAATPQPPAVPPLTPLPGGPILGIRPTEEVGTFTLSPLTDPYDQTEESSSPFVLSRVFITLQGILLGVALVLGILWLTLRRRR